MSYVLDKPVDVSNMKPSLRGPYSAAFPEATKQKEILDKKELGNKEINKKS